MWENSKVGAILLMGGEGRRFGSDLPKQFHRLAGKEIFVHTLEQFLQCPWIDEIVLACHADWIERVQKEVNGRIRVIKGGKTRQESSFLALQRLKGVDVVLIHDAVRPFVSTAILEDNVRGALRWGAVDTCIPSADTLVFAPGKEKIANIPLREELLRGQTPQTFRFEVVWQAHERAVQEGVVNASDDCRLVLALGKEVGVVMGDEHNIKITTELDLFLAEQLFRIKRKRALEGKGSVKGKKYAVIGGFGGIGAAVCSLLEELGAEAVALSRRSGLDLTRPDSIAESLKRVGPIDGLINCAGFLVVKPLALHAPQEIEDLLRVNFTGLVIACQKAQVRKGGHIINLSSSSFSRGRKNYGVYSAAKAAVVNFTQALAEEWPDLKIHAVIPQRTRTTLRSHNFPQEEQASLLSPREVAEAILALLQDDTTTGSLTEVRKHYALQKP